jgi:hypothetical protein
MSRLIIYRAIWAPSLAAILVMLAVFARQPFSIPAPGRLVPYTSGDKTIAILHPDNWSPSVTSAQATVTRVTFDPTIAVHFSVTSDLTGSLVADMNRAGGAMLEHVPGSIGQAANQPSPIEAVHAMQQSRLEASGDYPDFTDGETTRTQIDGHEAAITPFTYVRSSLVGHTPMVGTRVTVLFQDRSMGIVCGCPKDIEKTLMPVFDQMIQSVKGQ